MTRNLPEWIAAHDDQAIPQRVKLRIWTRCGGRCALTGRKLRPGDAYQFDHIVALANGGEHREQNLQLVAADAHRAKTKADLAVKSKIARTKAKHLGIKPARRGFYKPADARFDWGRGRYVRGE
jgi:5-methylcytosine-specific restriction endonuclease McrA